MAASWLVTGGCGFIGSHLVEALLSRGDRVRILDDLSSGRRHEVLAGAEIDFSDDLMGQAFKVNNPNATSSCGCGTSFSV